MNSTTFSSVTDIVFCPSRTVDGLRGPAREDRVGDCKISNRSNYTRITFDGHPAAAFLIPVGPYAVRILSRPTHSMSSFNFIGSGGEKAGAALTANELRAMAYGLLAAANWADSRDTAGKQAERRPARPYIPTI